MEQALILAHACIFSSVVVPLPPATLIDLRSLERNQSNL